MITNNNSASAPKTTIAIGVRISPDLHSQLIELAFLEHRSINREIVQLIEEAIQSRQQQQRPQKSLS